MYSEEPGDQDLVIYLGPDMHGIPLEVMGIEMPGEELLVVHAMKLRQKYREAYERVLRGVDGHRSMRPPSSLRQRIAVRVPLSLHQRVTSRAAKEGNTVSEVVRQLLADYAAKSG